MKKVGRPASENAKHKSITIRLSDEERKRLDAYATKHEMTMTAVVLQALDRILSGSED